MRTFYPAVGTGTCNIAQPVTILKETKVLQDSTAVLPSAPCQYDWITTRYNCDTGKKTQAAKLTVLGNDYKPDQTREIEMTNDEKVKYCK